MNIDELCINTIRFLSIDAIEKAGSGHPGMPMGDAAMAYILWKKFLKHNPKNPKWQNRDRFILSAGHGSMLLYSLLYLSGYPLSLDEIKKFRQWNSKTPGHPEYDPEIGVETTTGPLGQGFGMGVGMAIAEKYLREFFNRPNFPIIDYYIYAICSDGDIMEGISSEAASLAGHLKLGKLIYLYSDNKVTIEGSTDLSFSEDVAMRFRAYNWHVQKIDGYNLDEISNAIQEAKKEKEKPSLIIARTHLAFGCPNKQDKANAHGSPLGEVEVKLTKEKFNWPKSEFYVPEEVIKYMGEAVNKGVEEEEKWKQMLNEYKKAYPELYKKFEIFMNKELPQGWDEDLPVFKPENGPIATRHASGEVLNKLAKKIENLIGGSADLAPSNNTYLKDYNDFGLNKAGRNIHFGVREHAMGACLNGMALTNGIIPYGGTFLVFSDYMRPSIRLACLMKQHVIYIFTHDSIGIGEDGPTHQPVEHLASLRCIPNFTEIRPADANETREAWKIALTRKNGPIALILTRQKVPVIDRNKYASEKGIYKGAYIITDSKGIPDVIIIASGSEIYLALSAAEALKNEGIKIRVVNMASFKIFDEQSDEYKEEVLPASIERRIAIEAGASLSWYKYVGLKGDIIGVDRFGASAPYKIIFEKYGIDIDNIIKRTKRLIGLT